MTGIEAELYTMLDNLIHTADMKVLHPIDWYRFYDIIVYATEKSDELDFSEYKLREFLQLKRVEPAVIATSGAARRDFG